MQILHKKVVLKEVKTDGSFALHPVDHYEVFEVGDEVTKVKKGDTVLYEHGGRCSIKGEDYILTDEENIWAIL